jgi:hypothetical protein
MYSPYGSGAYTQDVVKALEENFFYTKGEAASAYDPLPLKEQIDLLQPILMSGSSEYGGHAYLVDGYREMIIDDKPEILFHFNWGWGGSSDGYFTLIYQPFGDGAMAYIDIVPATDYPAQCQQYKRQTAFEGYVTNGSTNQPYQSNPDCSWVIAAPGAKRYSFSFSRLDTQEDIDEVTIYNGSSRASGVAAAFSGTELPAQSVDVAADSVLITFTSKLPTKENDTHLGFLLKYVADKPQQKCDAVTYLTAPSGYITDGTLPEENYTPWVSCTWNITSNSGPGFFGLFHEFNLELGDFVDIYDATKSIPYFWRRFDRYTPPTVGEVINIPFPKIQVKFITDNFEEGPGFKFQYFSILGVNDNSLLDNLLIFPNPVSDFINLSFSSEWTNQTITCRIVDLAGKEVYTTPIEYTGDIYTTQIPVAHLSKGFYFLQLVTTTGKTTTKIIIN